jgi:hypothetical protein
MVGMLSPHDQLDMRQELVAARMPYRETMVVIPTFTSGSNYEPFTDSPYEITGAGQGTVTYEIYRLFARIKIVKDTTTYGVSQVVTGLEIGDYLLYYRDTDKPVLDKVIANIEAYIFVDGMSMRPYNDTLNGLGQTFDVFIHAKKATTHYRPTGL